METNGVVAHSEVEFDPAFTKPSEQSEAINSNEHNEQQPGPGKDDPVIPPAPLTLEERLAKIEAKMHDLVSKEWVNGALNMTAKLVKATISDSDDEGSSDGKDGVSSKTLHLKRSMPMPQANHMSIEQFQERKFSLESPHHAVDVVWRQAKTPGKDHATGETHGGNQGPVHASDLPLLLQINSVPLASLLADVGGLEEESVKYNGWRSDSFVLLPPFKPICFWEDRLRRMVSSDKESTQNSGCSAQGFSDEEASGETTIPAKAGQELESIDNENGNAAKPASEDSPESDLSHQDHERLRREALDCLPCLLDVYDKHIKPWWDRMRSSQVDRVEFGDLCALIQPGDLLHEQESSSTLHRVFRVVKITGGQPHLRHHYHGNLPHSNVERKAVEETPLPGNTTEPVKVNKQADESSKWTKFVFDLYFILYDGKTFKTVHCWDSMSYFSGRKDVRSLKYWPLRLADQKLRQSLLADGKRYFDWSKGGLYHYAGRTLSQGSYGKALEDAEGHLATVSDYLSSSTAKAEDVDSEIVIDFEGALKESPGWTLSTYCDEFVEASTEETETDNLNKDSALRRGKLFIFRHDVDDKRQAIRNSLGDPWVPRSHLPGGSSNGITIREDFKVTSTRFRDSSDDTNDFVLLPFQAFGYVLHTGNWACFDLRIQSIREVQADDSSWEELQLPDGHKTTMASLVERHFRNREAGRESLNFDFIEGKGKGLIVLLHGAPGVGKTSTAESLARKYRRPLLPITCGNLGHEAKVVEKTLEAKFQLAENWGCIVLLDEADVFLARRDKRDLQRNALVSVFLRTLEYYTGILILTTNRTGDFDEAFRSRIHIALFYDHLTMKMTREIWRMNLDRLVRQRASRSRQEDAAAVSDRDANSAHSATPQEVITMSQEHLDDIIDFGVKHFEAYEQMRRSPWNGRQIRNAFQTAVALCEYAAHEKMRKSTGDFTAVASTVPVLTWEAFKQVAIATNEFEVYLMETRGFSEEEMASMNAIRAHNYGVRTLAASTGHDQNKTTAQVRLMARKSREVIQALHPRKEVILPRGFHMDEVATSFDPFSRRDTMNSHVDLRHVSSPPPPGGRPIYPEAEIDYHLPYDQRHAYGGQQQQCGYDRSPQPYTESRGGYINNAQAREYQTTRMQPSHNMTRQHESGSPMYQDMGGQTPMRVTDSSQTFRSGQDAYGSQPSLRGAPFNDQTPVRGQPSFNQRYNSPNPLE